MKENENNYDFYEDDDDEYPNECHWHIPDDTVDEIHKMFNNMSEDEVGEMFEELSDIAKQHGFPNIFEGTEDNDAQWIESKKKAKRLKLKKNAKLQGERALAKMLDMPLDDVMGIELTCDECGRVGTYDVVRFGTCKRGLGIVCKECEQIVLDKMREEDYNSEKEGEE